MNCDIEQHILDDYFDGSLDKNRDDEVARHIAGCTACQKRVEAHEYYQQMLSSAPLPDMSHGRLLRKIKDAHQQVIKNKGARQKRTSFLQGFAAAMALVFLSIIAHEQFTQPLVTEEVASGNTNQDYQYKEVNVVIFVPDDMYDVELAITLPEGMHLDDYSETQLVAWTTDLAQGANQISLPVIIDPGVNEDDIKILMASITYKNKTKQFQLNVDLTAVRDDQAKKNGLPSLKHQSA
jgi:hypothetical protein